MGLVMRLMGSTGGPRVSGFTKLIMVQDKQALAAHLERLAATPGLRRIIVSHGEMITHDPAGVLRQVASGL
jgi:hypothetical protein